MRPVTRGDSPQANDYADYRDAFGLLVGRIGPYCSYCERLIPTQLAVEHIQAKNPAGPYAHLVGRWTNYLLGCANCNGTKGDKDVQLDAVFLPDRDNTFAAFDYTMDGKVVPAPGLSLERTQMAERTLELTGLDKPWNEITDENGRLIFVDRVSERMLVWLMAESSRADLIESPTPQMRRMIVKAAQTSGLFSIWMRVFENDPEMRRLLIDGFEQAGHFYGFTGTAQDCFDIQTTAVISPRPGNGLGGAGKI
jgi:uncharacterized protein (TIGR02646 family)